MALTQIKTDGIAADAVTGAKIADDAINSEHYTDGSIDNAHVADDQIDSEHYAADSIDAEHYAPNSVDLDAMAGIARGKLIVGDASGNPSYLAAGSDNHVLTMDANGDVGWEAASAGATLTGSTNNTVVTVTGANAMEGEANLTFNGYQLAITATSDGDPADILLNADRGDDNPDQWRLRSDATGNDFKIASYTSGAWANKLVVEDGGDVSITDGNLVVASGHGISFAATADGTGASQDEILEDYEHGSWTPYLSAGTTGDVSGGGYYSTQAGRYTRVGRLVVVNWELACGSATFDSMTGDLMVKGLPFAGATGVPNPFTSITLYGGVSANDYYSFNCTSGHYSDKFYVYGKTGSSEQVAMGEYVDSNTSCHGVVSYMMVN